MIPTWSGMLTSSRVQDDEVITRWREARSDEAAAACMVISAPTGWSMTWPRVDFGVRSQLMAMACSVLRPTLIVPTPAHE